MMLSPELMRAYITDRNNAFLSMDEQVIAAHCRRYGIQMPQNPIVFWAGIHKMRLSIAEFPEKERSLSRAWLMEHGFYADAQLAPRGVLHAMPLQPQASRFDRLLQSLRGFFRHTPAQPLRPLRVGG